MPDEMKAIRPPPRNVNARRPDTTTPLTPLEAQTIGAVPLATVPGPPLFPDATDPPTDDLAPQQTTLVISTTILHRGRLITIASEGRTLDAFCDLLDKRFGVAS